MSFNNAELIAWRDAVFDRLYEIWNETEAESNRLVKEEKKKATEWTGDNWRKANTLQAVAEYWNTSHEEPRRRKAMDLMIRGYNFYKGVKTNTDIWVDDFGWWAGFFIDLYGYNEKLSSPFDSNNLWNEVKYCYERMNNNFDKVHGGIWNEVNRQKNTITNSWMLNVSGQLSVHDGFSDKDKAMYTDAAKSQYTWLTTGQYKNNKPKDWRLFTPEKVLLWLPHEGDMGFAEHECWTGDEGVFLRGLSPYINIAEPVSKDNLLRTSRALIDAALKAFVDTKGILHESEHNALWGNDLATGKGVFMRLVTRFVSKNNFFNDTKFKEEFRTIVNSTAEAAWRGRRIPDDKTKWVIAPNWSNDAPDQEKRFATNYAGAPENLLFPQVLQTNGLDALNAAYRIRPRSQSA